MTTKFKVGTAFYFPVDAEHIYDSDPCDKDCCMVNRAFLAWWKLNYGTNSKAKSTNHGLTFEHNERKYTAVFDTKTAHRIYNYDQCYRDTRSKEKARASMRPFKVRMIIEASVAVPKWPAMSEEVKQKLRAMKHQKAAAAGKGGSAEKAPRRHIARPGNKRRELSL